MNRNVTLYPWYVALFGLMAWIPIFFLFFSQHLSLEQVLQLEAIYYVSVVLLEVPSGYFSDVVGRRATLLVSTLAMCFAYGCFLIANTFLLFAAGQMLLAIGFAFKSGTDTAFHYDSLAALEQTDQYGDREAIVGRNGLIASAVALFLGGLVGVISLRLPYALSLLGMLGALGVVFNFREPPAQETAEYSAALNSLSRLAQQLRLCVGYAWRPPLFWLLTFAILMTILNHVPYEFYQPYLGLLSDDLGFFSDRTPLIAGLIAGLSTLLGAWAAGRSIWLRERIGLGPTLLLATFLQLLLIGVMGLWLHPLVVPLILLRTLPMALMAAPLNAAIAPQVPQAQRATYLSMQSLAGRQAFAGVLAGLSAASTSGAAVDWTTLAWMLRTCTVLGLVGLVWLVFRRRALE